MYIYIYWYVSVFTTCLNMYYVSVALRVGASASSRAQLTDADEFRLVLAHADVCWHVVALASTADVGCCMLTYADVCWRVVALASTGGSDNTGTHSAISIGWLQVASWRMLTYAGVCWRMRRIARYQSAGSRLPHDVCWRMLAYADVCWRMLTYADVCWCMRTYADVFWRMLTCARMLRFRERLRLQAHTLNSMRPHTLDIHSASSLRPHTLNSWRPHTLVAYGLIH